MYNKLPRKSSDAFSLHALPITFRSIEFRSSECASVYSTFVLRPFRASLLFLLSNSANRIMSFALYAYICTGTCFVLSSIISLFLHVPNQFGERTLIECQLTQTRSARSLGTSAEHDAKQRATTLTASVIEFKS